MAAPFRLALGERLMFAAVGGRQVVDAGQQRAEELAVVGHAADGNAAEADAMIAALAADQTLARALPAHVVIGDRNFQRGVAGLRAGIGEEHMIEVGRRNAASRDASWNTCGWANWKVGEKSSSAAWRWIASTIGLRLWPALQHHSAAVASIISRPSGV